MKPIRVPTGAKHHVPPKFVWDDASLAEAFLDTILKGNVMREPLEAWSSPFSNPLGLTNLSEDGYERAIVH